LKKDIVPTSFFKTDVKQSMFSSSITNNNSSFDDIIKSKAMEIISRVNQISEVNFFLTQQNDKKKKK